MLYPESQPVAGALRTPLALPRGWVWGLGLLGSVAVGALCVFVPARTALSVLALTGLVVLVLTRMDAAAALVMALADVQYVFFKVSIDWFDVTSTLSMDRLAGRIVREVPLVFPVAAVLGLWHLGGRLLMGRARKRDAIGWALPVLLVYAAVGLLWSPNRNWSIVSLGFLLVNALIFLLFLEVLKDPVRFRRLLWVFAGVGVVHALLVLGSFLVPHSRGVFQRAYTLWPNVVDFAIQVPLGRGEINGQPRMVEFLSEYHQTAMMLNAHLAALGALLFSTTRRLARIFLVPAFLLVLFTSLFINTRGPTLGLLVMFGGGMLLLPSLRRRILVVGPAILALLVVCMALQPKVSSWLRGTEEETRFVRTESTQEMKADEFSDSILPASRAFIWHEAFRLMRESWGWGVGAGNFTLHTWAALGIYSCHPHSVLNAFGVDFGWVGLLFLAGFGLMILRMWKTVHRASADTPEARVARVLLAGLAGVGTACLLDFDYALSILWIYVALTWVACFTHADTFPVKASGPGETRFDGMYDEHTPTQKGGI